MRATGLRSVPLLAALAGACSNIGPVAPIEADPDDLDDVVVCEGVTFGELELADAISDECRARVEAIERAKPSSFEDRLVVLGSSQTEDGSLTFYVNGADEQGRAIDVEAFSDTRVEVIRVDRSVVELPPEALDVAPISADDGPLVAVAIANDYSQTMRDEDLEAVAALEAALVAALPEDLEGSVTLFSTKVRTALARTADRGELEAALAPDPTMPREWTALYDGMNTALEALLESERPIRLLVVASDGPDNAPSATRRTAVASAISANGIAGFVGGALFADATEFRSLFGVRGVVQMVPAMRGLPALAAEYVRALGAIVKLTIPSEHAGASRYRIVVGGSDVVVR